MDDRYRESIDFNWSNNSLADTPFPMVKSEGFRSGFFNNKELFF